MLLEAVIGTIVRSLQATIFHVSARLRRLPPVRQLLGIVPVSSIILGRRTPWLA
jgi:hypothetical protein